MKIGYIKNYKSDNQIEKIRKANVEKVIIEIFFNQKSKKNKNVLLNHINNMKKDDTLVVLTLEEFGETLSDIINVLKLLDEKDAHLQILSPFKNVNVNNKQLIDTLIWVKDKERKDIIKRQAKGLVVAKAKKMKGSGRPKKYSRYSKNSEDRKTYFTVLSMLEENIPIKRIADILNISRNTVYTIKEESKNNNYD